MEAHLINFINFYCIFIWNLIIFMLFHHLKAFLKYVIEMKNLSHYSLLQNRKPQWKASFLYVLHFSKVRKKNQRTIQKEARNTRITFHLSGSSYTLILFSYSNQYQGKQNVQGIIFQYDSRHEDTQSLFYVLQT